MTGHKLLGMLIYVAVNHASDRIALLRVEYDTWQAASQCPRRDMADGSTVNLIHDFDGAGHYGHEKEPFEVLIAPVAPNRIRLLARWNLMDILMKHSRTKKPIRYRFHLSQPHAKCPDLTGWHLELRPDAPEPSSRSTKAQLAFTIFKLHTLWLVLERNILLWFLAADVAAFFVGPDDLLTFDQDRFTPPLAIAQPSQMVGGRCGHPNAAMVGAGGRRCPSKRRSAQWPVLSRSLAGRPPGARRL